MLGTVGRGSMSRISRTSIACWKIPNTIKYLTHIGNIQRWIKVYIRWLLEIYSEKSSIRLVTYASQNQRSTVLLSIYSHPTLSDNTFRTYAKPLFVWQTQTNKNTHTQKKKNKETFESFTRHYYIIEVRMLMVLCIVYVIFIVPRIRLQESFLRRKKIVWNNTLKQEYKPIALEGPQADMLHFE